MATLFFTCAILLAIPASATASESNQPIRIIINDWTSQIVISHILGKIYTSMGYNVEQNTEMQWGDLQRGTADVQVEVWEGSMAEDFNRIRRYGHVIDAGTYTAITREDWWYPSYVEKLCPGLPDWRALKRCAAIFATKNTAPKGRYLAGPWEKTNGARIRALNLGFKIELVKKTEDLWVELEKAYQQRKPIVLSNWIPNWVSSKYDGKFIEFPAYAPECETKASWGVNKDWTYDCGNPASGWLKKAAWAGM